MIATQANRAGGATDLLASDERGAFHRTVQKAVDDEAASRKRTDPKQRLRSRYSMSLAPTSSLARAPFKSWPNG